MCENEKNSRDDEKDDILEFINREIEVANSVLKYAFRRKPEAVARAAYARDIYKKLYGRVAGNLHRKSPDFVCPKCGVNPNENA
jgi:hypothetical protein